MTLNVIGTGRVLHHRELVGRSLCYFLSITFAGRTFRWCSPSGRDIWETAVDGDQLHFHGMDSPQLSQSFDFESSSPVDVSASFEDLTFPCDVDLPELLALGHRLEKCEAEVAVLPDDSDVLWSERYIILQGTVTEPVFGDPETHANTAAFTVDAPAWEDAALFPPEDWVVDLERWPDADDEAVGKVFPFVFGAPGVYRFTDGTIGVELDATPGLLVATNIVMVAGHLVSQSNLDDSSEMVLRGSVMGGVNPSNLEIWTNAAGVLTNGISSGFKFAAFDVFTVGPSTPGEEFWVENWSNISGPLNEQGGYPDFGFTSSLRTGGDVLFYMLLQSSLQVDRGRCAVAQALLQSYILGGYIDERVSPYEWVVDNLLPILPISMSQGPKGIFPIVWRYDAKPTDCVGSFIEGARWRRVSGVERDESGIFNEFILSYAVDGSTYRQKHGVSGALTQPSDGTTRSSMVTPNLYARRSYLEHGLISEEGSSDIVWSRETAAQICAWKIRANALAKSFVTYEASAEHAWLEPGDPILVTDPDLYFDDQVCLVRTKTWDITSVVYELLILTEPAREAVPVVEGHRSDANTLILLKMDLNGSTTFIDESPYERTVTKNGTVTQTALAAYYGDAGADFGGTNSDFLSVADAAEFNLGTGDFTVEGWAKTSTIGTYQVLFWMGNSNTETKRFVVYLEAPSGGIRFFWKDTAVIVNNAGAGSVITADTWFHWSVQRSGDNIYVHIDGANVDSDTVTAGHSMFDWTGDVRVGEQDLATGELPWLGEMDDFRFSNVARYGSGSFTP